MKHRNAGFTLVEILIVVIILGILAAIVIPQFTAASNDARTSALSSDLQTLRSQLELYKIQHLDQYPPATSGTVFVTALTNRTNSSGTTGTDPNSYPYGPYLQKFPTNAFAVSSMDGVSVGTSNPADGSSGWYWNTSTTRIAPNDSTHSGL